MASYYKNLLKTSKLIEIQKLWKKHILNFFWKSLNLNLERLR